MAITIDENSITVDNDGVTLEDLYDACIDNDSGLINKIANQYVVYGNIYLTNNSRLTLLSVSLTYLGNELIIEKDSTLQIGRYNYDLEQSSEMCYVYAPNLRLEYGFGNDDIDNSGNLLIYGSIVDMWCFWSFFEGENRIEIIDSTINGFGGISGKDSIIRNVNFVKSDGRYGILLPRTGVKEYKNVKVNAVEANDDNESALYFNPDKSDNMVITDSKISGYDTLLYIEESSEYKNVSLLDCEILNGYDVVRFDNNTDVFIKNTFNPMFVDGDGNALENITIEVSNNKQEVVFLGNTDEEGSIYTELITIANTKDDEIIDYNPFKIKVYKDNTHIEIDMYVYKKVDKYRMIFDSNKIPSLNSVDLEAIKEIVKDAVNKPEFEILT